jgi:hypothetical protein
MGQGEQKFLWTIVILSKKFGIRIPDNSRNLFNKEKQESCKVKQCFIKHIGNSLGKLAYIYTMMVVYYTVTP